jgi:hypothetical protein
MKKQKLKGETIVFEVQREGKIVGVDVFITGYFSTGKCFENF